MIPEDEEKLLTRIRELEARIKAYPFWGAALTAMDEERRGLLRTLRNKRDERYRSSGGGTTQTSNPPSPRSGDAID
jgi:hypothetical protein